MKIKVAILMSDTMYLNRIVSVFSSRYSDKLQVYSFSNPEVAVEAVSKERIDVLLCEEGTTFPQDQLSKRCGFAYFIDYKDIDQINGCRAICKFQKAELIYKQILDIYSDNAENISINRRGSSNAKMIIFTSPAGGVGTSTVAAGFAISLARSGASVIYLDLEKFGSTDVFFSGEGSFSLSNVIFSLKTGKANFSMKLESCVSVSASGVAFFSQPDLDLDILELSSAEELRLLDEIVNLGKYDYVIVDMDFSLADDQLGIYNTADTVVMISDGVDISNAKIRRVCRSINAKQQDTDLSIINRMMFLYNKFDNEKSAMIDDIEIGILGGAPKFEADSPKVIAERISHLGMFDNLK